MWSRCSFQPQHVEIWRRLSHRLVSTGFSLHAEDVSQSVDRQADTPRQLQLLLQEMPHLLRVCNITEHPDLRTVPLDVSVARRQPGSPDGPVQRTPSLFNVAAVVLGDHPLGPLAGVEPVDGHHVTEAFGQRL